MSKRVDLFSKPTLEGLLEDDHVSNHWIRSQCLDVYVRKGIHFIEGPNLTYYKPCIMVANLQERNCLHNRSGQARSQGRSRHGLQLVDFMKKVEMLTLSEGYHGVFIENANNPRHRTMLVRHGYRKLSREDGPGTHHYYKTARAIARKPPLAAFGMPFAGMRVERPSLRSFLQDSTIHRLWIRDQVNDLLLQVQRNLAHSMFGISARSSMTVLDIMRYSSSANQRDLHWGDDHVILKKLLAHLEERVWRAGFGELRIRKGAISYHTQCPETFVSQFAPDADGWVYEMGYQETSAAGASWRKYLVKSAPARPR